MTSLPMPATWVKPLLPPASEENRSEARPNDGDVAEVDENGVRAIRAEEEQFLLRAFRSFSEAAASLEYSYGLLRAEVERLRSQLEETNADLAASLEDNRSMRVHLDRILEGLPCAVLVVSSMGMITRANPEALRMLNLRIADDRPGIAACLLPAALCQWIEKKNHRADNDGALKNYGILKIVDDSDRNHYAANNYAENNYSQNDYDKTNHHKNDDEEELTIPAGNGRLRWLAVRCAPIPEGDAIASVFILRDISERKQLEAAQARLRREQALAEMSSLLAHEMRNPLASLELFAGLLVESDLDGERRQWLEQVQAGLRTLAATVNNVLHFHSLPEPERARVDLGQLLDWARGFFAPLARQSGIILSSQNQLHGVSVAADRHRLEQVLLNLLLNAVRAMPDGGWIEIGGHRNRDHSIELRVADTGPGIAPEHLPHIFDPGFSTRAGSPGLGLAVCRKIIEQHGGTIRAASLPGRGAAFTVTIAPPMPAPLLVDCNAAKENAVEIGNPL